MGLVFIESYMSSIDSELMSMRYRLAALEKEKEKQVLEERVKKAFPLKTLGDIIEAKKQQIARNGYSKSIPLARFYDQEKVDFLEPIFNMLKNIQDRLELIEQKS